MRFLIVSLLLLSACSSLPDDATRSGEWSQGRETGAVAAAAAPELATLYFDYDRSNVRENQRPVLRRNAGAIRSHREWATVIVEGHADDRGSEEYNLALGARRAAEVKAYLVKLGTPADLIDAVSYGESRPVAQPMGRTSGPGGPKHDDSVRSLNRRVDFKVISR